MAGWTRLGLIGGAGDLPVRIAAAAGASVFVLRLKGVADPRLLDFPGAEVGMAEAGKILRVLKDEGCDAVVLAGRVRRPDFASLKPDLRGAALLPRVIAAAARGDGALLALLVDTLEAEGHRVLGAEAVLGELAAPSGLLGSRAPTDADRSDIVKAARLVAALGPFDVGQAAVVARGFVLAVEAAEGTDSMLERCATLPQRMAERTGVLVKRPKPGQERRIDLPVVGVETMRRAAAAGLSGVAIEAGGALIVDRAATIAAADAHALFVYGFSAAEVD